MEKERVFVSICEEIKEVQPQMWFLLILAVFFQDFTVTEDLKFKFLWNVCWFFPGGQYFLCSLLSVNSSWQYSQGWSHYFLLLGQYQAILFKWFSLCYLYIYSFTDSLFIPFCGIFSSFSLCSALSGPSSASKVKIRTLAIPKELSILCYVRQKGKYSAIRILSCILSLSLPHHKRWITAQ